MANLLQLYLSPKDIRSSNWENYANQEPSPKCPAGLVVIVVRTRTNTFFNGDGSRYFLEVPKGLGLGVQQRERISRWVDLLLLFTRADIPLSVDGRSPRCYKSNCWMGSTLRFNLFYVPLFVYLIPYVLILYIIAVMLACHILPFWIILMLFFFRFKKTRFQIWNS